MKNWLMKYVKSLIFNKMEANSRDMEVDEQYLQRMMAGDLPGGFEKSKVKNQEKSTDIKPESNEDEKPAIEQDTEKESRRKKRNQPEFPEIFLKSNRLSDRRMIYIGKDNYDVLVNYISIISDRKLSLAGYLDNIVSHHIEQYKSDINELYENRIGCNFFKQ